MKADKIRELDEKELAVKAGEVAEQLFRLKFQMAMGQMDGLKKAREVRKDRARMLTILNEKKRAAAKK